MFGSKTGFLQEWCHNSLLELVRYCTSGDFVREKVTKALQEI